jgi:CheY-like chemotaxis protein
VADDVDDNRNLFGIYLQKAAHHIDYAKNGTEAVDMAKQCEYDVIFMDVQMPELDGYQATQAIRKYEKAHARRPTQIIACTANAFSDDIAKSHQAGCDAHLSKPIRKDTILKVLQSVPKPIESVG